jgi:two-component system chemotaxis response regulator CheY
MKTLIVEDDFVSRALVQGYLLKYGTCHIAANGKEGVEAVERALAAGEPYELITLDIMMPELDGHDTLRQIRAAEKTHGYDGAKIVMTTAVSDHKQVLAAFAGAADAYMIKPITKEALLGKLHELDLIDSD